MLKNKKGFTLLELIVVIAIIAIIAVVVVLRIDKPKNKTADTAVKAQIRQIAAQAQVYYIDNGYSHAYMCDPVLGDPTVLAALGQINNNSLGYLCYTNDQNWAVSAQLKGSGTWCEDNSNFLGPGTAQLTATCL